MRDEIISRLPATLQLGLASFALALVIALPFGTLAAIFRRSPIGFLATAFTQAGVYNVKLTVSDPLCGTATATQINGFDAMIVVYDPKAGFVTGGGWINSPLGAYVADPTLAGKANFGFVSKYQKGSSVPTGETEFQFKVANFNFHSTSYDWLVVSGPMAQYKGSGTINNAGDYGFLLTAVDGEINGGGGTDKFRIKVYNKATSAVLYDNMLGSADGAAPTTVLGGGSIVIHTSGGGTAMAQESGQGDVAGAPLAYGLSPNFPQPFTGSTQLRFSLPERSRVRITVYDVVGRLRGVNRTVKWASSSRPRTPSTQPKHSASSTDSCQVTEGSPVSLRA